MKISTKDLGDGWFQHTLYIQMPCIRCGWLGIWDAIMRAIGRYGDRVTEKPMSVSITIKSKGDWQLTNVQWCLGIVEDQDGKEV